MITPEEKKEIDKTYAKLSASTETLYDFIVKYYQYMYTSRDYGNGELVRMVEVHTLEIIDRYPGISAGEVARVWKRTKGTVSVNLSSLESKGYIRREKDTQNAKLTHFYLTEKGAQLSILHKKHDIEEILRTRQRLMELCSFEEFCIFQKVIECYLTILQEKSAQKVSASR